jgi:hypothetical protein
VTSASDSRTAPASRSRRRWAPLRCLAEPLPERLADADGPFGVATTCHHIRVFICLIDLRLQSTEVPALPLSRTRWRPRRFRAGAFVTESLWRIKESESLPRDRPCRARKEQGNGAGSDLQRSQFSSPEPKRLRDQARDDERVRLLMTTPGPRALVGAARCVLGRGRRVCGRLEKMSCAWRMSLARIRNSRSLMSRLCRQWGDHPRNLPE